MRISFRVPGDDGTEAATSVGAAADVELMASESDWNTLSLV